LQGWEGLTPSANVYSEPYDLEFDNQGNLWVVDAASNMVLRFAYAASE
jgi:streptogramin lyase